MDLLQPSVDAKSIHYPVPGSTNSQSRERIQKFGRGLLFQECTSDLDFGRHCDFYRKDLPHNHAGREVIYSRQSFGSPSAPNKHNIDHQFQPKASHDYDYHHDYHDIPGCITH